MNQEPDYLKSLNSEQKKAVVKTEGPLLILAGAGAGKTKTLTHRILHLIKNGVAPENILAITFTNKAAKEMKERIEKLIREDRDLNLPISSKTIPFASTFHSLGVHILKENASLLKIPRHFGIFDKSDSKKAVKEAVVSLNLDPKQFEPGKMSSLISKEKGKFITSENFEADHVRDYFSEILSKVWNKYEEILRKEKAFDFDDLLLKTAKLLEKNENVRKHYQNIWKYIHIDEYQDTNEVQYVISKLLAEKEKNICVVGDNDQCLVEESLISTQDGQKPIEKIKKGEKVLSAGGNGDTCFASVLDVKKRPYKGKIIEIKTENGKVIRATPEHIFFSKLTIQSEIYYVYLMYKKEKGFRIGIVKGVRNSNRKENAVGLLVRCNQEKADRVWILKVCKEKPEAAFWESFYSAKYGIPQDVFHVNGRKVIMSQTQIDRLYNEIDTRSHASKLFEEEGLYFEYPHYFPQGTTKGNTEKGRVNIRLTMFSDRRKSKVKPWGLSRVSINTTDNSLKEKLSQAGFMVRKGKRADWRLEIARLDYGEAEKIAGLISKLDPTLSIIRTGFFTAGKNFLFQPAKNLHPTMLMPVYHNGKIKEESIISVEEKEYVGHVYDLNVSEVHNYVAQNIAVHNCIYSWRGANIKNIMNFEKDYPEAEVVILEENYRSTQTIIKAANIIIDKNRFRVKKNLFTKNPEGEKIGRFEGFDENHEAQFVAQKSQELIEKGVSPEEIAVLYRANFQSRALEEAFLKNSVPYQMLGVRFFERAEIKDILSFIKASLNPDSLTDIKRIINVPPRGIGKVTLLKIFEGKESELPAGMKKKVSDFRYLLEKIKNKALKDKTSETVKFVMKESGMENSLKKDSDEDMERLENMRELATLASKYDEMEPEEGIEKLLSEAALATDQDSLSKNERAVKLMTVHAAKGLEFDYVFVTGLEENLFPHKKLGEEEIEDEDAEEERRLFYVALTRGKKKVYLTNAQMRTIFGSREINIPSEFIGDIDEELLEFEDGNEGGGWRRPLINIEF